MSKDAPSRHLPKDVLAAIGDVIVHWSHLETLMDVAIYSMLSVRPGKGAWVTAALRLNARLDVLRSVGGNFFKDKPDLLKAFNTHVTEISNCYIDRNSIDHAIWWHFGPDETPSVRVRVTAKAIAPPDVKPMTAGDILKIRDRIDKEFVEFDKFLVTYTPEPPSG